MQIIKTVRLKDELLHSDTLTMRWKPLAGQIVDVVEVHQEEESEGYVAIFNNNEVVLVDSRDVAEEVPTTLTSDELNFDFNNFICVECNQEIVLPQEWRSFFRTMPKSVRYHPECTPDSWNAKPRKTKHSDRQALADATRVSMASLLKRSFSFWTCHICGDERPDAKISVHTRDISQECHLPQGTMFENVRYCNDRAACFTRSATFRLGNEMIPGREASFDEALESSAMRNDELLKRLAGGESKGD